MKTKVLVLAGSFMALVILAAFAWDSLRHLERARRTLEQADAEMRVHEERLIGLVIGTSDSPELKAAIEAYQSAPDRAARIDAFETLIARFRQTSAKEIDPTHPLDRKFMDDIAGTINRHEVARRQYDLQADAYQHALAGLRGRVGRILSSKARDDWNARGP
jgi:hypothetical protein